jgi:integrase
VTASGQLALASCAPVVGRRVHADRVTYKAWLYQHATGYGARWARLDAYDRFVERWPVLQAWFDAPLRQRLFDHETLVRGQNPHGGASVIMPYLIYLSLVHGVGLDYPLLLGRSFRSPLTHQARHAGLGIDLDMFGRHVARLGELGYADPRQTLLWPLGRMLLHRGDPDLAALGMADLDGLGEAVEAFTARMRLEPLRQFYARREVGKQGEDPVTSYLRTAVGRLHATHVLLFDIGQVDRTPIGRTSPGHWTNSLAPAGAPPKITAVVERYLRLHLDANLDRPQTVRHARDALRRLVRWLTAAHPGITSLAELHREHAEEFLRWLGAQNNQHTGQPLSLTTRRSVVTLITRFATETAAWQWGDVPAKTLFTHADIPKINKPLPRFIPDHELAVLMAAVDQLPDPCQWAALIVARWSGARRDEIRRLAVDCLDAYPDGHPRLRIPVGKGHTERSIPLHPQAAEALRPLIDRAREQRSRPRFDPGAGRTVQHLFLVRGDCCPTRFCSTCPSKPPAPPQDWSTRPASRQSAPTGSVTRLAPNSPKVAPAFRRSWPCSVTGRPTCRSSTRRCPTQP